MGCEILLYRGSALIVFGLLILVGIVISKVKNNRYSKVDSEVKVDEVN